MDLNADTIKKSDLQLLQTALRRGYKIEQRMMDALPIVCAQILSDTSRSDRIRLSAIKTMAMLHGQNIKLYEVLRGSGDDGAGQSINVNVGVGVKMGSEGVGEDRLAEVADEWGVPVDVVRDALSGPGSDVEADGLPAITASASQGESA